MSKKSPVPGSQETPSGSAVSNPNSLVAAVPDTGAAAAGTKKSRAPKSGGGVVVGPKRSAPPTNYAKQGADQA